MECDIIIEKYGKDFVEAHGNLPKRKIIMETAVNEFIDKGLYIFQFKDGEWTEDRSRKGIHQQLYTKFKNIMKKHTKRQQATSLPNPSESPTVVQVSDNDADLIPGVDRLTLEEAKMTVHFDGLSLEEDLFLEEEKMTVRIIPGNQINWGEISNEVVSNMKGRLERLVDTITIGSVYHQLKKMASNPTDKSTTAINSAIQVCLDPDDNSKTAAYNMLSRFTKDHFIPVNEITLFLEQLIRSTYPVLSQYKINRLSLLIQDGIRGPQPTHSDTKAGGEKFGIMVLSEGSCGTTYYDMQAVATKSPTVDDIRELWKDAPPGLIDKIGSTEEAAELLRDYGQLLYTHPSLRKESGVVPRFTTTILDGSHPHCAPSCLVDGSKRIVLFFVLQPPDMKDSGYSGEEQCSKEKLVFLLYESLLSLKEQFLGSERAYILAKFVHFVRESASFQARDGTFDLPKKWVAAIDTIYEGTKLWLDCHHKTEQLKSQLALAKVQEKAAYERLQSNAINAIALMQGDDFGSELMEDGNDDDDSN